MSQTEEQIVTLLLKEAEIKNQISELKKSRRGINKEISKLLLQIQSSNKQLALE